MTETCASSISRDERHYWCKLDPGHSGLHRWDDVNNIERARVWTDEGVDFLEGPYSPAADPDSLTCYDHFTDAEGTHIYCVRPKGHSGQHGNYHDEQYPAMWSGYEGLPAALNTWSKAPPIEGDIIHADFEVVITNSAGTPKAIRLNGLEIPRVKEMTVEYSHDDARVVILEIYASSLKEVSQ